MLRVKDRLELQLLLNGKEFPFDNVNTLDFIHLSSSSRLSVPMLHLRIQDLAGWCADNQVLEDGAPIEVTLVVNNEKQTFNFRRNTLRETRAARGATYELDGYLDAPKYWLKAVEAPIEGSSNTALQAIASDCGLVFSGVPTADKMTWQPKNMKYHQMARYVSAHGYTGPNSCMGLALNFDKELRYRDLSRVSAAKTTATFVVAQHVPKSFVVTDYRPRDNSGVLNSIRGYAEELHSFPLSDIDRSPFKSVNVKKLTKTISLARDIHKAVEKARVMFAPIDCGNTHPNYDVAQYQNQRLSSLFCYDVDIVTPDVTKVKVFDVVEFVAQAPEGNVSAYSGKYLVTSKSVYVSGINYYERLELSRQGVNAILPKQM